MKRILAGLTIAILISLNSIANIQSIITVKPTLPTESDSVLITFDASLGTKGLMDFTGDVYAHTGVITDKSSSTSDWKYVKAKWNENIAECKLTRISNNSYQLKITPSIKEFYEVPDGETIQQIAMVFRSADGSKEGKNDGGKDIFTTIYKNVLSVTFTQPDKQWLIVDPDSSIEFKAACNKDAQLSIKVGDSLAGNVLGKELNTLYTFDKKGSFFVTATAKIGNDSVVDSIFVCVKSPVTNALKPDSLADGITYMGDTSATLILHAPSKENIFLIGDFNEWLPKDEFQLKRDGDKWWYTIDGLTPGKDYGFQYLVDGEFTIADPYTEKILDPWNDKYIADSTYKNLQPYPERKTDGVVSVLQPGKRKYVWDVEDFTPAETSNLVIYELLIRDFTESHTIKAVQDKLDYIQNLGINAIELMPFNEFEGNSSWGYNPSFYFATDKYYGTENEYKEFIDSCHKRGIAVIMDIVFNHAYGQNPFVQLYFDNKNNRPDSTNPWFNVTSPNSLFSWGYDFDHEAIETQKFIDRNLAYWMNEFKVDGFRFDFTKGFTNTEGDGQAYDSSRIAILKRYYDVIKEIDNDALLICEHLADNSEETELANYGILLWGNINHSFGEASMSYLDNSDLAWASHLERGWDHPNLIAYMESHDEERLMYKNLQYGQAEGTYSVRSKPVALDRIKMCATLYFTIPGPKMIWQFGELGYDYSIDYNGRVGEKPVVWNYYEEEERKELYDIYSLLVKIKTELP
ncbi:MAG: alpha-amylase family glycosyl hydrolase, partial [Bacteroidales bacterium]|nr:alpha-amylase family glycosyl hydrolase [Bacteroidales bacterium]